MTTNHATKPIVKVVPRPDGLPPPKDEDLEASILGYLMFKPLSFDRVADILQAEHFFPVHHQFIYQAIADLAGVGMAYGDVEVAAILRDRNQLDRVGGPSYLLKICYGSAPAYIERAAKAIRDKHRLRLISERCQRIHAETYGRIDNVQDFLDEAEQQIAEVAAPPEQAQSITLGAALKDVFTEIHDAAQRGSQITGVPTGFYELDQLTGGLHGGEQIILAGRPGMGKTALGMAIAMNVAKAHAQRSGRRAGVLFFSLEMNRKQLSTRTICTAARVNYNALRTGHVWREDTGGAERLARAAVWLSQLPIIIHDQQHLNPLEMRAIARRTQADWARTEDTELVAIVLDYLQFMRARSLVPQNASREQEVAECSRMTKAIANELNLPVLALAQLNRALEKQKDKRPQLSDLRESGAIEMNADTVIFIHREEYYLKDKTPPHLKGQTELIVAKQRNGPLDTANTRFFGPYTLFADDPDAWKREDGR